MPQLYHLPYIHPLPRCYPRALVPHLLFPVISPHLLHPGSRSSHSPITTPTHTPNLSQFLLPLPSQPEKLPSHALPPHPHYTHLRRRRRRRRRLAGRATNSGCCIYLPPRLASGVAFGSDMVLIIWFARMPCSYMDGLLTFPLLFVLLNNSSLVGM